jgi:hypothetical protein
MSDRRRTYLNYLFENMTYLWDVDVDDKVTHWAKVQSLSTGNTVRMDILDSSINLSSYNAILMLVNNSGKNKQGSTGDNLFASIVIRKDETIGTDKIFNMYLFDIYSNFTKNGQPYTGNFDAVSVVFDNSGFYCKCTNHSDGTYNHYIDLVLFGGNGSSHSDTSIRGAKHMTFFGINE